MFVEVGESDAVKLSTKVLVAELTGSWTFQTLKEEVLDRCGGRVCGKKDLDNATFAGDIDPMNDWSEPLN